MMLHRIVAVRAGRTSMRWLETAPARNVGLTRTASPTWRHPSSPAREELYPRCAKNSKSGRRGPGVLTPRTHFDAQADEGSVVVQPGAKCRHATSFSPTSSPHAAAAAAPSGEAMWTAWRLLSAILRAWSWKEGGVSCTDKVPLASYRRRTACTK